MDIKWTNYSNNYYHNLYLFVLNYYYIIMYGFIFLNIHNPLYFTHKYIFWTKMDEMSIN